LRSEDDVDGLSERVLSLVAERKKFAKDTKKEASSLPRQQSNLPKSALETVLRA
jgi:hypothetical protein